MRRASRWTRQKRARGAPKNAPDSEEVMSRKALLAVALLVGVAMPTAWPEASQRTPGGETKFTTGWVKGDPTLRAEGRGVTFFKRVGRDKVSIRVEVPGDVIELEAGANGLVTFARKNRVLRLEMKGNIAGSVEQIQKLSAGSKALAGFEGLVAALAPSNTQEAQSLRSSHALLSAVRGVTIPVVAAPPAAAPTAAPSMRTAALASFARGETPYACWAEYSSTMYQYNVVFNSCIGDYWWVPGWTAACGLQFAIQSELAWFWLLSCSGGMPV